MTRATLRILYVEDNEDLREAIGMLVESEHRHLVCCGTAEEALAAIEREPFDVLMTDVSLPGLSGTELARRWLAPDPARWAVLCSGYLFGDELKQLGPNVRSLPKPFEFEQMEALFEEIERAIAPLGKGGNGR